MSFNYGTKVKFGNQNCIGIVKDTRNEGPTSEYEETLVYFEDGDQCWVSSCYLTIVQDVNVCQEVTA